MGFGQDGLILVFVSVANTQENVLKEIIVDFDGFKPFLKVNVAMRGALGSAKSLKSSLALRCYGFPAFFSSPRNPRTGYFVKE